MNTLGRTQLDGVLEQDAPPADNTAWAVQLQPPRLPQEPSGVYTCTLHNYVLPVFPPGTQGGWVWSGCGHNQSVHIKAFLEHCKIDAGENTVNVAHKWETIVMSSSSWYNYNSWH